MPDINLGFSSSENTIPPESNGHNVMPDTSRDCFDVLTITDQYDFTDHTAQENPSPVDHSSISSLESIPENINLN